MMKRMNGAVLVAIAATVGNFLQGWDNAAMGGAVIYIKKELQLGPAMEGLIVAMSLIGATLITTCAGSLSDWIGRRPMLILSSMFYFLGALIMSWSPNFYVLLLGRLLDGFGVGLALTLVPLYISETAPSEIRGLLNTLPQFTLTGGIFLSYCMVFGMSLQTSTSWRLILGVISIPSILYFALMVLYLPESPRWLVSKGRMAEAKKVLQRLRGKDDVSGEMALLVEGLAVGGNVSIEEYIISPVDNLGEDQEVAVDKESIKLYRPEEGLSWVARPVTGQSRLSNVSHPDSIMNQNVTLVDPLVTLFDSVHEKLPEMGSIRSILSATNPDIINEDPNIINEEWDIESQREGNEYACGDSDSDDNLQTPLLSRQTISMEKDTTSPQSHSGILMQGCTGEGETIGRGIGGGWQLAWKWGKSECEDGRKGGGLKRIYLHEGILSSRHGSLISLPNGDAPNRVDGEYIHVSALVSQPAHYLERKDQHGVGPRIVHPSETVGEVSILASLLEPGVKRALIVGIGLQILQQFAGISGIMCYSPQILDKAGVAVLLSKLGLSSNSATFLVSAFTNFLMLPSIGVAMKYMDTAGRRSLLLKTIPMLILSLIILVIGNAFDFGNLARAIISIICLIIYFCAFTMGLSPIPNILCSEIFPTRVSGICIAICALTFWICDVIVTYTLPVMLNSIGLPGVFGICAVVSVLSLVFVCLRVPETKGMPLEVITEFFAVGSMQAPVQNE